jgi:hypothetical protein
VTRALPIIVALALAVYALIDCLQADHATVRGPRRPVWIALIVLVPFIGPIAWIIARGRFSRGQRRPRKRPSAPPPVAPDDNPEFLRQLRDIDEEHEEMLTEWEADLRRREEELRDNRDDGDDGRST